MLKNYFVTAWRNLVRNKFYSILNITGLAIGLAVGILILLWVRDELSYDRFHSGAKNIYKINAHIGTGADEQVWETVPAPLAGFAKQVPEIEKSVRIADNYHNSMFVFGDKVFNAYKLAYVDPSFFDIFDFKLIKGDKKNPFKDSHSVVLTESVAAKFFGNGDPLGKIIVADKKENFTVTGVIKDFPQNSTINYNMIFPMTLNAERFTGNGEWKTIDEDLGNYYYNIFLLLRNDASAQLSGDKLSRIYERTRNFDVTGKTFTLQALTDLHLYTADGNQSAMQTVRTFSLVAVFILIIACINYVNLSTARSILRSREVSVRKIIGAERKQLFIQFLVESAVLFSLSAALAFLIIQFLLPLYNEVSGKLLQFNLADRNVWLLLAAAIGGSLAIASIYPALLLSSFRPIEALKGKLSSGMGNAGFRKVLVVTQFVFSVMLIIATIVVGLQLKYIREKDLGYDKDHVLSFSMRAEMYNHFDAVKTELTKVKGVLHVGSGSGIVGVNSSTSDTEWEGKEQGRTFLIHPNSIDKDFIPLFNMKMVAGKNFSGTKADSSHIILNETAVKEAGIKDPVGKKFKLWETTATIIGVVKDYNYASLKQKIEPSAFYHQPANYRMFIKTTGRDAANVIAAVEKIWKQYSAEYPFLYSFVDDDYNAMYKAEERTGILFNVFAVVAITISCLGLLGLATYTAQVKKREVGIRKVLGATVSNITTFLAKDFLSLVLISLLVAVPVAWWAMNRWLQDFAYRVSLSWWIFLLAGAIALFIALITVSIQAVKAAMANPVKSLKEE